MTRKIHQGTELAFWQWGILLGEGTSWILKLPHCIAEYACWKWVLTLISFIMLYLYSWHEQGTYVGSSGKHVWFTRETRYTLLPLDNDTKVLQVFST